MNAFPNTITNSIDPRFPNRISDTVALMIYISSVSLHVIFKPLMHTSFAFRRCFALAIVFLMFLLPTPGEAQNPEVLARDLITGIATPWEILWGPDGWIWFTERRSRISRMNPTTGETHLLTVIPDNYEWSEAGLFGMALDPSYPDSPYIYVMYTHLADETVDPDSLRSRVVRYTHLHNEITEIDSLVEPHILIDSIPAYPAHCGGRLLATADRALFFTVGDRANYPKDAQNSLSINGKILRINLDGTVPKDNPGADNSWPLSLIWTKGHRNPQGLTIGAHGYLYSSEHGPTSDDEVNLIERGRNYGWWPVHGYCDDIPVPDEKQYCIDSNIVEPLIDWTPTIAPMGIEYYNHPVIPAWQNSLILASTKSGLHVLKLSEDGRSILNDQQYLVDSAGKPIYGRIRDVCVSPDGRIFVGTTNTDQVGHPGPGDDRIMQLFVRPAGVDREESGISSDVVPNPIVSEATFHLPATMRRGLARIFDATGRLVRLEEFQGGSSYHVLRGKLPSGIYYLEVEDNGGAYRARVVMQ
jgi:glucose/arabinose dehydrogenase